MRHIILLLTISLFVTSCGQNDTKQKELELKEKELALKEKELNQREKDTAAAAQDTGKKNPDQETAATPLVLTPLKMDGDIGHVTFSQNNKTVFYFDAKSKKGKINLNGVEYLLTKMEGTYTLSGNNVTITATGGKWAEMESDCAYGKALAVTIKMGTQVLKVNNVDVQDCSSMVQ